MPEQTERPVRWGIVGTGGIAGSFARDLKVDPAAGELLAVASRTAARADAFAATVGAPRAYGSYEHLVADADVDVVYVAVPHVGHHAAARLALSGGKAVLVEKPFTINRTQAEDLVALARERELFLMEAMWTRFLPHTVAIRRVLAEGRLGEIRLVLAELGFWFRRDPAHRLFDLALGGGALLDLGVYPISFASMVLGQPVGFAAASEFDDTGVDAQTAVTLRYPGGAQAVTLSSVEAWLPNRATIAGRDGRIEVDSGFFGPTSFTLVERGGATERHDEAVAGGGMQFEALEVARCLRAGRTESPVMPLAETVSIMDTMDRVRAAVGLRYPGE